MSKINDNHWVYFATEIAPNHTNLKSATEELSKHFNIAFSRHNLRDYVLKKQKSGINLKNPSEYLCQEKIELEYIDEHGIEYDSKVIDLREKVRIYKNKYELLIKEKNFTDFFIEEMKKKLTTLPQIKPKYKISSSEKEEEQAILNLSDFHLGENVNKEEMFNFNEYNFGIFEKRLLFIENKLTDIIFEKLKGYNIPVLNIFGLGDWVTGRIHEELIETADLNIVEQIFNGAQVLSQFLLNLSQRFSSINCDFVVGNHGRLTKDVRYKNKYVNWDYILFKIIETTLSNQKNIKFNIPKSFFTVVDIYDKKILLMHGDSIRSWSNIPFYGIEKTMNNFTRILDEKFDYCMLGHFHSQTQLPQIRGEVFINGSFIGGNEYSLGKLNRVDEPSQLLCGIHPKYGISWRYNLKLKFA